MHPSKRERKEAFLKGDFVAPPLHSESEREDRRKVALLCFPNGKSPGEEPIVKEEGGGGNSAKILLPPPKNALSTHPSWDETAPSPKSQFTQFLLSQVVIFCKWRKEEEEGKESQWDFFGAGRVACKESRNKIESEMIFTSLFF